MSEPRDTKIKRLAMRSMRRGIKEMDLILTDFAGRSLQDMPDNELDLYDMLLAEPDLEIYGWILGQTKTPAQYDTLIEKITKGAKGLVAPTGMKRP